ncbi:MAG: TRAP transporter large permease [Bacillota bacterium]
MTVMIATVILFFLLLLTGVPVYLCFAVSSMALVFLSSDLMSTMIAPVFYSSMDSFPLLAIPFFMYAGDLMAQAGVSRRLVDFAGSLVGRVRGYLGAITVIGCMFFGAVSGSGVATCAAVGGFMIPEMVRAGYPRGYACSITAAAAALGIIIPPSVPFVLYGFLTNTSVADLFLAGIVPGLLLGVSFLLTNYMVTGKILPRSLMKPPDRGSIPILESSRKASWSLLMPVIVLGGIYGGFFTATEAAAVSVVYSMAVGLFVYKDIAPFDVFKIARSTAITIGSLGVLLVFATLFTRIMTHLRVTEKLSDFILGLTPETWVILIIVNLLLIVMGMFMDGITAVLLVSPVLYDICVVHLGMDPVHLGVIIVTNLAIGLITPPMAMNIFLASQISGTSSAEIFKSIPVFLVPGIVVLILITLVPELVTFLPKLLK